MQAKSLTGWCICTNTIFFVHLVSECHSFNTGIVCAASSSAHLLVFKIFLLGVLSITHLEFYAGLPTLT